MHNDIREILLTEEQIQAKVKELGEILTAEYAGKNPIVVGVLKGVAIFYADMIIRSRCPARWTLCGSPPTQVLIPPAI